ncbi:Uncharacterised protein [Mycobacteroides abscessus subsp. abscessus]|nr:Uncharacterised protein [Mycobacteroides abscessus subsp. abscessus]
MGAGSGAGVGSAATTGGTGGGATGGGVTSGADGADGVSTTGASGATGVTVGSLSSAVRRLSVGDSVTSSACRSKARANLVQESKRSSGDLPMALISTSFSGSSHGLRSLAFGGGALRCWLITAIWLVSWYGVCPVSNR